MENDLISRSALLKRQQRYTEFDEAGFSATVKAVEVDEIQKAPAVDAVEVDAQEIQYLIDALYYHIRWMKAGKLDRPECGWSERIALMEKLVLYEREHFPDMQAETEG